MSECAFLFELRRSVPLYLFYQGGPNTLDQPNAIRSHGQEPFGRINPGFDQYTRCPITEPTLFKPRVPLVCPRHSVISRPP
jgi:hypothetical protein